MRRIRSCMILVPVVSALLLLVGCSEPTAETGGTPKLDYAEADYVGSEKCAECHDKIYAGWLEANHSQVIQRVEDNPLIVLGDFTQDFPPEADSFTAEDAVLIHGIQWKQRYIDSDWRIRPAQWNLDTERWAPYHADDWQENDWRTSCAYCHVVGYDIETNEWEELSVGCEACHGPGSAHADSPRIGNIINPARLTPKLAADVCGQCHTRGSSPDGEWSFPVGYMPGMSLNPEHFTPVPKDDEESWWPDGSIKQHRQQHIEWKESDHFPAGVGCIDCHTVHSRGAKYGLKDNANSLCRGCHDVSTDSVTGHAPIAGAPEHSNCVGCHMPPTGKSADYGDEHTHRMWVIKPQVTIDLGEGDPDMQPNSCNHCHEGVDPAILQSALDAGLANLK